ncbi:MAG: response regulator [Microbacter sp.]
MDKVISIFGVVLLQYYFYLSLLIRKGLLAALTFNFTIQMKQQIGIISDDIVFSFMFSTLLNLRIEHVMVSTCATYQEIDRTFDVSAVNLILIDGKITTLSSIEVVRYFRITKRVVVPIWFFPEITNESYLFKIKEMGVNQMIYKPFDPYLIVRNIQLLMK